MGAGGPSKPVESSFSIAPVDQPPVDDGTPYCIGLDALLAPFELMETTLYHAFGHGAALEHGQRKCFGTRAIDTTTGNAGEFQWSTYAQTAQEVAAITSGLARDLRAGWPARPRSGCSVRTTSSGRCCEQACNRMAYVVVPLYDTLGADAIPYIANQTDMMRRPRGLSRSTASCSRRSSSWRQMPHICQRTRCRRLLPGRPGALAGRPRDPQADGVPVGAASAQPHPRPDPIGRHPYWRRAAVPV